MKNFYLRTTILAIFVLMIIPLFSYQAKAASSQDISAEAKEFAVKEANLVLSKAKNAKSDVEFIKFLKEEVKTTLAVNYMGLWVLGSNRTKFSKEQLQTFLNIFHKNLSEFYGSIIYQNKDKVFTFKNVK